MWKSLNCETLKNRIIVAGLDVIRTVAKAGSPRLVFLLDYFCCSDRMSSDNCKWRESVLVVVTQPAVYWSGESSLR